MGKVMFSHDVPLPLDPDEDDSVLLHPLLNPRTANMPKLDDEFGEVESFSEDITRGRTSITKHKRSSAAMEPSTSAAGRQSIDFSLGALPRFNIRDSVPSPSPNSGRSYRTRNFSRDSMDFEQSRGGSPRPSSWNERVGFKSTARRLVVSIQLVHR